MPNKDIQYIPFGVDNKFWKPKIIKTKEEYIFAIGNDNSRDWETLIDSWDDSLPTLKIVTSQLLKNNKTPIVVGGSGLYLEFLCKGVNNMPKI